MDREGGFRDTCSPPPPEGQKLHQLQGRRGENFDERSGVNFYRYLLNINSVFASIYNGGNWC